MKNPPPVPEDDLRERAVHWLSSLGTVAALGEDEARRVVDAMRPLHLLADTVLFEEGAAVDSDYLVLVLEGQVRVQSGSGGRADEVVISVAGPGSLLGEMGVIDGSPRAATCTALTDVKLGLLSRAALLRLVDEAPQVAARLLLGVSKSLADRLRESNRRLRTLSQVTRALQSELDAVHAVNHRLLGARP